MMKFLPLFPLEIIVFPGESLNLHIFEDRYKKLVQSCYEEDMPFGIPAVIEEKVSEYGTAIFIDKIEKVYPNGEMDIRTRGSEVFRVLEFMEQAENVEYPGGIVSFTHEYTNPDDDGISARETFKILKDLLEDLTRIMQLHKNILPSDKKFVAYKVAHYLNMPLQNEYELLLAKTENERQQLMIKFLRKVLPDIAHRESIRHKINMNGHFKHLNPPHY